MGIKVKALLMHSKNPLQLLSNITSNFPLVLPYLMKMKISPELEYFISELENSSPISPSSLFVNSRPLSPSSLSFFEFFFFFFYLFLLLLLLLFKINI